MSSSQRPGHEGTWIKATRSSDGGSCVEMRRQGRAVQVRDSKDPSGPILAVSPEQFAAWVHAAADGEFGTTLD